MKKVLEVTLGIVTSIGGFLEVGAIATAAQAGAAFGFQLMWAVVLGTLCVIFLVEMSGRLAAVGKHPLDAAIRERFGFSYFVIPLAAELITDFLLLGAEIGGVSLALQLLTGIRLQWWALAVAFVAWLVIWLGTFGAIERGMAFLGLITLVFVLGAVQLRPAWQELGAGLLPTLPRHDPAHYWFIAVSILGAVISPYLFSFYSSGGIEDQWDESYLGANRAIAVLGMSFGSVSSLGVLVISAMVLFPRGIQVDRYEQAALMLTPVFGYWGFVLFAAALAIACFGAVLEIALDMAYMVTQGFGWNWGESVRPRTAARFSLIYTAGIFLSALLMVIGIDPLQLTLFTMAFTAVILPFVIFPFLVLMNDAHYVGEYRNGWISNSVVLFVIGMAFVIAVVAIPLQIWGG
jgi:Mn2+/Fe2+ NRAMP family transporter